MNTHLPFVALSLVAACTTALAATEQGTVISSRAVTAPVTVPLPTQCTDQQELVQPHHSGGGAMLGAVAGGLIGHNFGDGFGRAAATGLGAVAGSVAGDRIEAASTQAATAPVRTCQAANAIENRIVGYDVTYEYNGRTYQTRMAQDPGKHIALDVAVVPQEGTPEGIPLGAVPVAAVAPTVVYSAVSPYPYWGPYGYDVFVDRSVPIGPRFGTVIGGGFHRRGF